MDPLVVQQPPRISSDGFSNVTSPADSASLTFNLTGLSVFTNYSIHMTVSTASVGNAPIEREILARTTMISKNFVFCIVLNFHVMKFL